MKRKHAATLQFTVRNVPAKVGKALKGRARQRGTSLNMILVEALTSAAGLTECHNSDMDDLFGTWIPDNEFDAIIRDQDQIDEEMWK